MELALLFGRAINYNDVEIKSLGTRHDVNVPSKPRSFSLDLPFILVDVWRWI